MSTIATSQSSKMKIKSSSRKKKKDLDIYTPAIITRSLSVPIINVGNNLKNTLLLLVTNEIEGKCISEGYIKHNSSSIISYSNGVVEGSNIYFEVVIECLVCNPVEGMHITCTTKNITKAGIRAQVSEENNPLVIFIARDHNYMSKSFSAIQEDQEIKVRVIGKRFELNDTYISIIAELVETKTPTSKPKVKLVSSKKAPTITIKSETLPFESDTSISPSLALSEKSGSIAEGSQQSQVKPTTELAIEPVEELAVEPVEELAAEPVEELAAEPVEELAVEPVDEDDLSISLPQANLEASIPPKSSE